MALNRGPMRSNRPGCYRCRVEHCPSGDCSASPVLVGWRLGLACLGLFLGPVLLAILGAALIGEDCGAQLPVAISGLGLGMLGSILAARQLSCGDNKAG
jgi:hypothetical protein